MIFEIVLQVYFNFQVFVIFEMDLASDSDDVLLLHKNKSHHLNLQKEQIDKYVHTMQTVKVSFNLRLSVFL